MIISKKDVQGQSDSFFLPNASYRARVIGTSFGDSSKGNPMTTLDCEIIEPEQMTISGEEKVVAGRKFSLYLVHVGELVGQQRTSSQAQVFELCEKLGIELETDEDGEPQYDTSMHKDYFLGQEFDIVLSSEERIKRARPDKSKGEKVGKPILDGEDKEIKDGWRINANISDVPVNCRPSRNESIAF